MKKLQLISGILLLTILSFSCSGSDDAAGPSCDDTIAATLSAQLAFTSATNNQYTSLCNAYKAALENQIEICGDTSGDLQAIIDDLADCTLTPVNTSVISVKVGTLTKTFETDLTVSVVGTTRRIKAYDDMSSTDFVYFEIQQGATGATAISNFNIHLISSDYNPLPTDEGGNWMSNISVNSTNTITGTFYGYVTSPTTGADLSLTQGSISVSL